MPAHDPTYDLILMLDTAAPDEQREKLLADVERALDTGGVVVNRQDWGVRQTAYEIRHKTDAEYHLVQFHAGPDLLETLNRILRFADGVVRFRIIKLAPGTPAPPQTRPEPRPAGAVAAAAAPAAPAGPPVAAPGATGPAT